MLKHRNVYALFGKYFLQELNPIYDGIASFNTIYDGKVESVDSYEVEYQSLDFVGLLGEGAFGRVVKAEYYMCDGDRERGNGKVVAVKMMKGIQFTVNMLVYKVRKRNEAGLCGVEIWYYK